MLMLFKRKTVKYVSDADQMLKEFNKTHSLSSDQQAEYNKYQRIYELRDNPDAVKTKDDLWSEF